MVENTVFENGEIESVIKKKYGVIVKSIKSIPRGSANLFEIRDEDGNKYALKEFQSKYDFTDVEKEIKVINHLKNDGIKVPDYIKLLDGKYSFVFKERTVIMQKFIQGDVKESNIGTYDQLMESAKVLTEIINSLENLDYELPYDNVLGWIGNEKLEKAKEKAEILITECDSTEIGIKIANDLKEKIDMIKEMQKKYAGEIEDITKVSHKNTHGDYNVLQFIYKDEKVEAVIDFAAAKKLPICWEIIRSYSYLDIKCKNGTFDVNNFIDYVKEFCKYSKLNEYDKKYMPYIYLMQILVSPFGYKQYIKNKNESLLDFAYLRTNICRYLYRNMDTLVERLKKI